MHLSGPYINRKLYKCAKRVHQLLLYRKDVVSLNRHYRAGLRIYNLLTLKKKNLLLNSSDALRKARLKASVWHNNQKRTSYPRCRKTCKQKLIKSIPRNSDEILELALAMLYFGEGSKKGTTSMGAADPLMLSFFLASIERVYHLDRNNFRYDLHLRYDQDELQLKEIWSKQLCVSIDKFKYVSRDKRSIGKPTRNGYPGVCQIFIGDISIRRRLISLYNIYCSEVVSGT